MKGLMKSVSGAVANTIEIEKLDKIVERRVKQFDRETDELIAKFSRIMTTDEITQAENQIIENCFRSYDGEAEAYMGRKVNPDWIDGGGNNLEVRKRMLNRELQKKKGKLATAMDHHSLHIKDLLRTHLEFVDNFVLETEAMFPMNRDLLQSRLAGFYPTLDQRVAASFPAGYRAFDDVANKELSRVMDEQFLRLRKANENLEGKLKEFLVALTTFKNESLAMLPLKPEFLSVRIDNFYKELKVMVITSYPDGYEAFNNQVRGDLEREVNETFQGLREKNVELIRITREEFQRKMLGELAGQIRGIFNNSRVEMRQKIPPCLNVDAADDLNPQVDMALAACLSHLKFD